MTPPSPIPLGDGWTLRPLTPADVPEAVATAGAIPATVPGTVHTDLLTAGLIPDPYLDDHERLLTWIGLTGWRYATDLPDLPGQHDRVDLVFEGLDTVAGVLLDDVPVATVADMHRTHRVDVTDRVTAGAGRLVVDFASAVREADRASQALGARPHVNHHPYNALRKMACNFGWDWGPDLVTAGIWRPVSLHGWSTARLAAVRPVVGVHGDASGRRGTVSLSVDIERAGADVPLTLRATVAGVGTQVDIPAGATTTHVELVVPDVQRWWPRGHGAQPLYDLVVSLATGDGAHLEERTQRIGFRTIEVVTTPDDVGTGFVITVNGRPILIKGVNWIPDDAFPHRVTRQRYAQRLQQATDAGVNLIRVWGGGIYESDDFYAECDERGLLVWQDFLLACAAYAEEDPLRSEVVAEARDNVTRLMPHPSLALWCGNNENLWGYLDWDWAAISDGKTWGVGYYLDVLPAIVAELDPGRAYVPGSPWSPDPAAHPNDPDHGTMHIWDVWNDVDYRVYRQHRPRFASEFGWQGPPTWSTLRAAISDDPLTPESPGMLVHQKAMEGHRKLSRGLVAHLPIPDDMAAWHWAMSLNQARAVRFGVEHLRSLWPHCTGSVVWQLNDCWPVTSWAAVDGYGRAKPLLHALRQAHADRLITVQPRDGGLAAVLLNDTDDPWEGPLEISCRAFDGTVLQRHQVGVAVPARGATTVPMPADLAETADPAASLTVAELGGVRGLWFEVEDRDSALGPMDVAADAFAVEGGYVVRVTAAGLVRDLAVLADKVAPDAVCDDMLLTLLAAETAEVRILTDADLDPSAFLAPDVLVSANTLLHPRTPF